MHERNGFNILYLSDPDPRGSMGLGGKTVAQVGAAPGFLTAIDHRTGKVAWRHQFPGVTGGGGAGGVLATAGDLVFTGDAGGNFVAFDATSGTPLWHSRIGTITNAPETYAIDGRQYVLVAPVILVASRSRSTSDSRADPTGQTTVWLSCRVDPQRLCPDSPGRNVRRPQPRGGADSLNEI